VKSDDDFGVIFVLLCFLYLLFILLKKYFLLVLKSKRQNTEMMMMKKSEIRCVKEVRTERKLSSWMNLERKSAHEYIFMNIIIIVLLF